jgi:hypothetical protein
LQAQQTIDGLKKEPCIITAIEREPTEHHEYWSDANTLHQRWQRKTHKNWAVAGRR